jgi:Bacterial sugar transferase
MEHFLVLAGSILGAALSSQLADEFKAWTPALVKWLLKRAVKQLPSDQRNRYEEEWLSHCAELPGQIGKILHALSCFSAARSIRRPFSWADIARRTADIVFATVFLLFLAPLMVCLALAIRLSSHGPVLHRGTSTYSGREYKILRFRVSEYVVGGDETSVCSRRTRLGALIKSYSLDELPILFNILVGEISVRDVMNTRPRSGK